MSSREDRSGARHELVRAAREYIEAHCTEKFSLQAVSGALYVNGSYLLRTFRELTGMTLLEYHNIMRCEKAKELLTDSSLSISRAGELAGFVSSAHFSRIFKKITGDTPSAYRQKETGDGSLSPKSGEGEPSLNTSDS